MFHIWLNRLFVKLSPDETLRIWKWKWFLSSEDRHMDKIATSLQNAVSWISRRHLNVGDMAKALQQVKLTKNSIWWIESDLIFCWITDESLRIIEGNITGSCSVSLIICDNFDFAVLENANTWIGSAKIDSYGWGRHCELGNRKGIVHSGSLLCTAMANLPKYRNCYHVISFYNGLSYSGTFQSRSQSAILSALEKER